MPIILVGGGSRSGKSSYALQLASAYGSRKVFIATAQIFDDEMRERVCLHREERGDDYTTIEEPYELAVTLSQQQGQADVVVVDCLTLWLTNLLLANREAEAESALSELAELPLPCILITNEVGCGIVPDNALARRFRDLAGRLNQQAAALAIEVHYCVFGIPIRIKPNSSFTGDRLTL